MATDGNLVQLSPVFHAHENRPCVLERTKKNIVSINDDDITSNLTLSREQFDGYLNKRSPRGSEATAEFENNCNMFSDENNQLCRACLSSSKDNKCIFTLPVILDHENYRSLDLWEKLQLYGGIEVAQNDGFPAKMCSDCISKINVAHEFRIQCQRVDDKLRALYKREKEFMSESWAEENSGNTRTEIGERDEFCKTEEFFSVPSITDTPLDINSPSSTNEDSKNENFTDIAEVEDANPICKVDAQRRIVGEISSQNKLQELSELDRNKLIMDQSVDIRNDQDSPQDFRNELFLDIIKDEEEKMTCKKDAYRSRRLFVFKRVTSIQNLRNHKERQRQFIKKTVHTKHDSNEQDIAQFSKNGLDRKSESPISQTDSVSMHKCLKCCRSFPSKICLAEHTISHDNKKFSCDQCDKTFSRLNKFLEHTKLHELKEKLKPASCKICNKNFRKAETMVRHLHVHKKTNPREVYSILKDMRERRKLGNVETQDEKCANTNCLEEKLPDSKEVPMRELRKRVPRSQNNRNHTSEVSHVESNGDKDTVVESAKLPDDKSAIKLINMWIREELDSDNEGKGFPCKVCSKSYVTRKSLMKHEAKMHNKFSEFCSTCENDCICPDKIKENDKPREKSKSYTCEECNKTFEKEVKLEKHLRIHARAREQQDSNFKRFLCHICSKTFRQNTGLMFHMRTHTGYKPHVCKYCGRGFTSNSNCINHERTHTGDRPFVCQFCNSAFAKSCTLKAHVTTHTGEANYHCKTCGKSFRRLKYLKEHRFTHTGEKPYVCKICGTAYSHSGSLFVHEKKCKAQFNNYHSASDSQSYCQSQTAIVGSSATAIPTIITTLPPPHNLTTINSPLTAHTNKNYSANEHRMNIHNSTGSANSRNFSIIGQMFHT